MAEQKATLIVEVVTKGEQKLKEAGNNLDKLTGKQEKNTKTQDKSTKSTDKASSAAKKLNMPLGKQIPLLRSLGPLMGTVGLAFGAGATAIGALVAGALQCNQAYNAWQASILGLTVTTNIMTDQFYSKAEITERVNELSEKYLASTKDIAKAMDGVLPITRDLDAATNLIADAFLLSHEYGVDFATAVNELTKAYDGQYSHMGAGMTAYDLMIEKLSATGDETQGLKDQVNDAWSKMTSDIGQGIGSFVSSIGNSLKIIAVDFMWLFKPGDGGIASAWNACAKWLGEIDWDGIWNGLGKAWSNVWRWCWDGLQNIWGSITGFFKGINWDAIWNGIGEAWSKIWRFIPNMAIEAINWMIQQANKVSWTTPDWLPLIGGKTFGFNLKEIPYLAEGGNILSSGAAVVGEEGPELLNLPRGAQVSPLSGGGATGPITIPIYIGNELLQTFVINSLEDTVRLRGAV